MSLLSDQQREPNLETVAEETAAVRVSEKSYKKFEGFRNRPVARPLLKANRPERERVVEAQTNDQGYEAQLAEEKFETFAAMALQDVTETGILHENYYYTNQTTRESARSYGVDERVFIHPAVAEQLIKIDELLRSQNLYLYIKDGWRSPKVQEYARYWFIEREILTKLQTNLSDREAMLTQALADAQAASDASRLDKLTNQLALIAKLQTISQDPARKINWLYELAHDSTTNELRVAEVVNLVLTTVTADEITEVIRQALAQFSDPDSTSPHISGGAVDVEVGYLDEHGQPLMDNGQRRMLATKPYQVFTDLAHDPPIVIKKTADAQTAYGFNADELSLYNQFSKLKNGGFGYALAEEFVARIGETLVTDGILLETAELTNFDLVTQRLAGREQEQFTVKLTSSEAPLRVRGQFFLKIYEMLRNRRFVHNLMAEVGGFVGNPSESWHFGWHDPASAVFVPDMPIYFGLVQGDFPRLPANNSVGFASSPDLIAKQYLLLSVVQRSTQIYLQKQHLQAELLKVLETEQGTIEPAHLAERENIHQRIAEADRSLTNEITPETDRVYHALLNQTTVNAVTEVSAPDDFESAA